MIVIAFTVHGIIAVLGDSVVPGAAIERVDTLPAHKGISLIPAINDVIASSAGYHVAPRTAVNRVTAGTADNRVVAGPAVTVVIGHARIDNEAVIAVVAEDRMVLGA